MELVCFDGLYLVEACRRHDVSILFIMRLVLIFQYIKKTELIRMKEIKLLEMEIKS